MGKAVIQQSLKFWELLDKHCTTGSGAGLTQFQIFIFDSAIWSITERYSNDVEVMVGGHLTRGKRVHRVYPEGVCKKGVLSPKEQSGHTRQVFVSYAGMSAGQSDCRNRCLWLKRLQ